MEGVWKVRTQAGVCLIWPSSYPSSSLFPILFTCLSDLKGALCVLMCEVGGRESRKGDCHRCTSFLKDGKQTNRNQKPTRHPPLDHQLHSHTAQTCLANSGLLCHCGFCCQALKLEGRCLNSLRRNSALTLNAAVSSTPTTFFLLLLSAALSSSLLWDHVIRLNCLTCTKSQSPSIFLHRSNLDSSCNAGLLPWRLQVHPHQTGPACLCLCNAKRQREPLLGWQCK